MATPARRRQWIALILSGLFPGLGQFYVRAGGKGVASFIAGAAATWALARLVSVEDLLTGRPPSPGATAGVVLALLVLYVWSIVDAWRSGGKPEA
jgi:uncharacterized membrane protein